MTAPMDSTEQFQSLQDSLKTSLLSTTRTTTQLCAEDLTFHRSLDPSIARALDEHNARLLQLAERLLGSAAASTDVVGPKLADSDALESNWRGVVDVIDSLLERVDMTLDDLKGVVKRGTDGVQDSIKATVKKGFPKMANILKPQRAFESVPKNNDMGPFKPLLTYKPHAKVPLEKSLRTEPDVDGAPKYQHPYRTEIDEYKYPISVYQQTEPIPYRPFESTTAILVDTPESLAEMLTELKMAKEIAIDLEHHDMRSYVGIVSLMQISTRDQDWIVDTLKPWRRRLECLNEVFADPNILKVFHGSGMDMIWLQRDFGVYMVGMFDTERAAVALRYPRASLAFLLEKFIKFQAQKQHQLADWRVRPLSKELFDYARADTHFLLYIYDCMRNELIQHSNLSDPEGDLLQRVLDGSKVYQLQRYEVPLYDARQGMGQLGWYKILLKTPALFSREQFSVFKALHQWRDKAAREDDDSIHFVMSNHALMTLAREMPTSREKLMAAASQITGSMRSRQDELVRVISKAKAEGATGPEMRDVLKALDEVAADQRRQKWAAERASVIVPMIKKSSPVATPPPTAAAKRPLVVDPSTVRAGKSQFWGSTLGNNIQQRPTSTTTDVRLALPLPQLTAEIFSESASFTSGTPVAQTADSTTRPAHAFVPATARAPLQEDDVFVIKDLGGRSKKRKVTDVETEKNGMDAVVHQADEMSIDPETVDEEEKSRRKAERRARKAEKRAKKEQEQGEGQNHVPANGHVEDEEAFDYANAPTVLHARDGEPGKSGKKDRRPKKDRGFDPYAKSMDAPKGLPRSQKEKAGRTATFRPPQ